MKFRNSYFKPWYTDTGIIIWLSSILFLFLVSITRDYLNEKYIEKYLKELRTNHKK
jgi:hypothetical protein